MVGSACIRRFLDAGHRVLALTRGPEGGAAAVHERLEVAVIGEVLDDPGPLERVDAVLHLAALRSHPDAEAAGPQAYASANVALTANLAAAARDAGSEVFCLASTIAVYSRRNDLPFRETDEPRPASAYGASKLAAERTAAELLKGSGTRCVSLRLAQVIGPDRSRAEGLLMSWIALARRGEPLPVFGDGSGIRDFVSLSDAVSAFERALEPGGPRGVFNIGGGRPVTLRRLAETVNRVFANPAGVRLLPDRRDPQATGYMSSELAESELQWRRRQSLEAGLASLRDPVA